MNSEAAKAALSLIEKEGSFAWQPSSIPWIHSPACRSGNAG
jgi:hypothetical protein